jgi:NADH:ubiquinone oxidoreductase subunit K
MGAEIMLNAVNITLITFSRFTVSERPVTGYPSWSWLSPSLRLKPQLPSPLRSVYRNRGTVDVDQMNR